MTLKEKYWEDGNIFKMNDGRFRMVWGDKLIDNHGYIPKSYMSDSLVNTDSTVGEKVIEIYHKNEKASYIDQLIKPKTEPIWKISEYIYTIEEIKEKLGISKHEDLFIID